VQPLNSAARGLVAAAWGLGPIDGQDFMECGFLPKDKPSQLLGALPKLPQVSPDASPCVGPDDDPYDPRKPEYVLPASQDEVDATNSRLLEQQITKLEASLSKRRDNIAPQVLRHYEHVLDEMCRSSCSSRSRHTRRRSDPSCTALETPAVQGLRSRACSDPLPGEPADLVEVPDDSYKQDVGSEFDADPDNVSSKSVGGADDTYKKEASSEHDADVDSFSSQSVWAVEDTDADAATDMDIAWAEKSGMALEASVPADSLGGPNGFGEGQPCAAQPGVSGDKPSRPTGSLQAFAAAF